ncbi:putative glycolipid-binding domain-containing protein [Cupriavidus sp. AU9028]|uniref:putative glycolipid-binding domain-containing protein n=1 Tax=Cupriavidus sp. AU9028 TaxID=2871157 RepID=UPI001C9689BC|nr:putative glycolipid-binding domain-containing protein [Cupriavidus sp. AU9028]MBY4899202.1 putative glycolipid-binding domain-containing protein [Cupriavidus sp. AU9028]
MSMPTLQPIVPELVCWSWMTQTGLDAAAVLPSSDGVTVHGRMQAQWDDGPLELAYRLDCGPRWAFRQLRACTVYLGRTRTLSLWRDDEGWHDAAGRREDLAAARFIDIMATPITNTLPVAEEEWSAGVGREFTMAYVRLPELQVRPVRQRYTLLANDADGTRRFRYETLGGTASDGQAGAGQGSGAAAAAAEYHDQDSGFSAEIVVDANGLVLYYPPYWRRMPAAQALAMQAAR